MWGETAARCKLACCGMTSQSLCLTCKTMSRYARPVPPAIASVCSNRAIKAVHLFCVDPFPVLCQTRITPPRITATIFPVVNTPQGDNSIPFCCRGCPQKQKQQNCTPQTSKQRCGISRSCQRRGMLKSEGFRRCRALPLLCLCVIPCRD